MCSGVAPAVGHRPCGSGGVRLRDFMYPVLTLFFTRGIERGDIDEGGFGVSTGAVNGINRLHQRPQGLPLHGRPGHQ